MIATYKTRQGAERYARFLRPRVEVAEVVTYGFNFAVQVQVRRRPALAEKLPGWTKEARDG